VAGQLSRDGSITDAASVEGGPLLNLQRVFDLSQDLMCMTDAQTHFVRLSASCARILGYRPEELLGRKFLDLVHPNDLQSTLLAHESVLRGAQVVEFENRYVRKDGSTVELSWTSSWIAGADGSGATYSVARDITNRKRAERLRESQREVLQLIVSGSPLSDVLRRICRIMEAFDADPNAPSRCSMRQAGACAPRSVRACPRGSCPWFRMRCLACRTVQAPTHYAADTPRPAPT
jgi:PAS domain S-box-containing protein